MRSQSPITCELTVLEYMTEALQAVFDDVFYPDPQFRNLLITPDYPINKQQYPSIVVDVNIDDLSNAGLGHVEYFRLPNGNLRKWGHWMYSGSIDLTVFALSKLDRIVLSDSLVEILAFGKLDSHLQEFFWRIYGNPADDYDQAVARFQLALTTDKIQPSGQSVGPTPWESSDELIYSKRFSIPMFGGFYNAVGEESSEYVQRIDVYPFINGEDGADEFWVSDRVYEDYGTAHLHLEASSE